jgi:hypothetical protein
MTKLFTMTASFVIHFNRNPVIGGHNTPWLQGLQSLDNQTKRAPARIHRVPVMFGKHVSQLFNFLPP